MRACNGWFTTLIYSAQLQKGGTEWNRGLAGEILKLREFDEEGRRWSARNYAGGYTSYGSMDRLHQFSSTFMDLERLLRRHVRAFARSLDWELAGRSLSMTDCWANIMPQGVAHSLHLHPNSVVSGTYYVVTPKGCPGLRFEDPRLACLMAAPPRRAAVRPSNQAFVVYPALAGRVTLFESWLRHEVPANPVKSERISVSFNFDWV